MNEKEFIIKHRDLISEDSYSSWRTFYEQVQKLEQSSYNYYGGMITELLLKAGYDPALVLGYVPCCYLTGVEMPSFDIPQGIKEIESFAFAGSEIPIINIPNGVHKIYEYAFENCTIKELIIPPSVTVIESAAFKHCEYVEKIVTPILPDNSLEGLFGRDVPTSLISVLISSNQNNISPLFANTKIKEVVLANGIVQIRNDAFYQCTSLTDVYLPKTITNIGEDAFRNCGDITIHYDGNMSDWKAITRDGNQAPFINTSYTCNCRDGSLIHDCYDDLSGMEYFIK